MKFNLGAGTDIRPGFVNLDIRKLPGIDIVADMRTYNYPSGETSFIVLQHSLEYIPRSNVVELLQRLKLALSLTGVIEIRVTDWSLVSKYLYLNMLSGEQGISHEMAISMLYGRQAHQYDIIYNGFTLEYLQGILNTVGFKVTNISILDFDIIITAELA